MNIKGVNIQTIQRTNNLNTKKKKKSNLIMGRRPEKTFLQRGHTNGQQVHKKVFNVINHQGNAKQNHNETFPHTSLLCLL